MIHQGLRRTRFGTQVVLLGGFGGLLALMAVAGADSVRVSGQIQASNAEIRRDFVVRERRLDQIRSALYLSGNVVRDYLLLDPGLDAGETLRAELKQTRDEMDASLRAYFGSLRPEESEFFARLESEVNAYWAVLDPVLAWDAQKKRELAYWFVRRELFPRRAVLLEIARHIATVNEQALREGERRTAELFARHRRRLLIISGFALGLGLLVAAFSVAYILRLERDADERYRESLRAQEDLKELSARLVEAQERERQAISRELHDEVGQSLTALLMDAGNVLATAPAGDGVLRQRLESIKKLAESTVSAVRNMALLLRPSMLDDLGLVPALEWQARETAKRTGLRVDVVDEHVSDALPEGHKTCVYRVVQEALNNCARHATAHQVRIVVRQEPNRLLLNIQDDGQGFDASRIRGLGLVGMAERVAHLGGDFAINSKPGRGTVLRVDLPLETAPTVEAR